jgi:hypothetical protein
VAPGPRGRKRGGRAGRARRGAGRAAGPRTPR